MARWAIRLTLSQIPGNCAPKAAHTITSGQYRCSHPRTTGVLRCEDDDDEQSQGGTGAAADGLLACYPENPTAATAADLINYKRGLRGADPLMFDLELSTVAQAWADHLAEIGASDFNPDLISQLPEVPIPGSTIYEWVVTGSATADQIEFVLQVWQDEGFANGDSTHMGVGWATDDGGTAYLYFFFVQYEFSDIGPDAKF